jgi:hypothetical protein
LRLSREFLAEETHYRTERGSAGSYIHRRFFKTPELIASSRYVSIRRDTSPAIFKTSEHRFFTLTSASGATALGSVLLED